MLFCHCFSFIGCSLAMYVYTEFSKIVKFKFRFDKFVSPRERENVRATLLKRENIMKWTMSALLQF